MGKLYFVKYLPVEGEIKEADNFLADALSKDDTPDICSAGENVDLHLVNNLKSYKKVKLFLCSRDIQVGDMVISNCRVDAGEFPYNSEIEGYDFFKKIGEVSPDAIWVKEGDEFDEDELEWNDTKKYHDFIEIKHPITKTFH